MKFDDFLSKYFSKFGRYQKIMLPLIGMPILLLPMHVFAWTFAAIDVPYRCALDNELADSPYYSDSKLLKVKECHDTDGKSINTTLFGSKEITCTFDKCHFANDTLNTCEKHVFDHSRIKYSAIERWEITCDRDWIKATIQSVYYIGQLFGALLLGILADRIGRKKVFMFAILNKIVSGLLLCIAPWWWLYGIFRLCAGFSHFGIIATGSSIGMELVKAKDRRIISVIIGIYIACSGIFIGFEAMFITDYRLLHLVMTLPSLIFISYWWIIPESPRWLVTQKRYEEADKILQKMAKCNKIALPERWWDGIEMEMKQLDESKINGDSVVSKENEKTYEITDLFRTKELRKRTIIGLFLWFVVALLYYGIATKANVFGGDYYLNFILGSVAELPAILFVYYFSEKLGRRPLLAASYFITGICILLNWWLGELHLKNSVIVAVSLMFVSKCAVTCTFATNYLYFVELCPTPLRNTLIGTLNTSARIGAITSSYVILWIIDRYGKLCMVIPFVTLAFISTIVTIVFLPETRGKILPETIAEVERKSVANQKESTSKNMK